jgi:hypothetical protein
LTQSRDDPCGGESRKRALSGFFIFVFRPFS